MNEVALTYLHNILTSDVTQRKSMVALFQSWVWGLTPQETLFFNLINDLAVDLDFYEPDTEKCQEHQSYFGDQKLCSLVTTAISKLKVANASIRE